MSNIPEKYHPRDPELFQTQFGQDLWEFMKRPENVKLMEDGTAQGRPAVELLTTGLLREFDPQIKQGRRKKMVGHMASRIMLALGYEFDSEKPVPVEDSRVFTLASRYRKP